MQTYILNNFSDGIRYLVYCIKLSNYNSDSSPLTCCSISINSILFKSPRYLLLIFVFSSKHVNKIDYYKLKEYTKRVETEAFTINNLNPFLPTLCRDRFQIIFLMESDV